MALLLIACSTPPADPLADTSSVAVVPIAPAWVDSIVEATPWQVALGASHVAVIASGEPRVTIVRREDATTVHLTRVGAGPGEMRTPVAVWFAADTLQVVDVALAKVLSFDTLGHHLVSRPIRASGIALAKGPKGWSLTPGTSRGAIARLVRTGTVDSGRALGTRTADPVRYADDRVAYAGAGRIVLYESAAGQLSIVDTLGAELYPRASIPDWLDGPLRDQFRELAESMARRGGSTNGDAALIKFLAGDGTGRVLLFYVMKQRHDLGYAIRYDPATRRFVRLAFPSDSTIADALWRASAATVHDDVLIAVGPGGVAPCEWSRGDDLRT